MKQQLKYRNFYKCALQDGICHGFVKTQDLCFQLNDEKMPACCITAIFDTGDSNMTYHRLKLDCSAAKVKLEVIAAVTDDPDEVLDNGIPLRALIENPNTAPQQKRAALRGLRHVRKVNTEDFLLHELEGRYIWICVSVYPESEEAEFLLRGMRLEFPRYSFLEYFPEIYQNNDFFERYISVFQTLFLEQEQRADAIVQMLDYESTDENCVRELAGWLGIEDENHLFSAGQIRSMIKDSDLYQGKKGTRQALEAVIRLAVGVKPVIVEGFRWRTDEMSAAKRAEYGALYGETDSSFCVILDRTAQKGTLPVSEEHLEKLVKNYSMVGTKAKIVVLDQCTHMDGHCYLGINSALSTPEIAAVDLAALGTHITVG